jgi:hypothetical protein
LCDGEGLTAAVHAALSDGRNFAEVMGTDYAAAKAAGYAACVAQYCHTADLTAEDVLPLLSGAATPLTDEEGDRLSPRLAGAGYVHGECVIPQTYIVSESGRPVSAVGNPAYGTAYADLIIRQPGEGSEKYTLSGIVFGDGWVEKEGACRLTGDTDPLAEALLSLGDSYKNLNVFAEDAVTTSVALTGEERISVRIQLPKEAQAAYESVFGCGYYLDAFVILTDREGKEITHPITAFVGDWGASPLMDFTVYDDTPALRQKTYLSVLSVDAETDIPIGVDDPTRFPGQIYDTAYNIIPADGSTLVLSLSALRDIDRMYLAVTDSEGVILYRDEQPGIKNLLDIYCACNGKTPEMAVAEFEGKGYGVLKDAVAESVNAILSPLQARVKELDQDKDYMDKIILDNADKASYYASKTLRKVQKKIGYPERPRRK